MKKMRMGQTTLKQRLMATVGLSGATALLLASGPAHALNLYDGSQSGNNLEINLTTTASWTGAWRVSNPSATLLPGEDGDSNFKHGLVANLFSIVPVLDLRDGDLGAHVSGQLYLNTPYLGTNQNNEIPYSGAIYTSRQNDFTTGTRNADGENAQLLDAFIFAQHTFADDQTVQFKLGRSVLFWGQSLFFPTDGISGGQAPINVVSAQNLINPQAQQVFMPVGQGIITYQPRPGTTLQAYYQFEWAHDYFQGEGAYFASSNALDKGAGYLGLQYVPGYGEIGLTRTKDANPEHQNGQFGLSVQQAVGLWDLGVFTERFDAKAPELGIAPLGPTGISAIPGVTHATLSDGTYTAAYARDTWLQGASFSTNVGDANVAGEFSVRENQPLVPDNGGVYLNVLPGLNTSNNPGYPVGNTWDAQLSSLYASPAIPLDPGGVTLEGEIILNHLINVTQNRWGTFIGGNEVRSGLGHGGQATAGALDIAIVPTYNDVLPNLQITLPVGLTYNYLGRSYVDSTIYHGTGVLDLGVTATYKVNWIASLSYQDYLGKPDASHNALADRGFVSLNLQHTF